MSTLAMIASPSLLLSFEPLSPQVPLKGLHDASSVRLAAGWHRELNTSLPGVKGRQRRRHSLIGLQDELQVVDLTGVYSVNPDTRRPRHLRLVHRHPPELARAQGSMGKLGMTRAKARRSLVSSLDFSPQGGILCLTVKETA